MARLPQVVVVFAVAVCARAGGYFVGYDRGETDRKASCREVRAHERGLLGEEAREKLSSLAKDAQQFALLAVAEELAILARQNPECFTPGERAEMEAQYQEWKRGLTR